MKYVLTLAILCVVLSDTFAQTNWPMVSFNRERTSWIADPGAFAQPLQTKTVTFPEPVASLHRNIDHMVYDDGAIYCSMAGKPNYIVAYDYENEQLVWYDSLPGSQASNGSSPIIAGDLVIAGAQTLGVLTTAFDRTTGDVVWARDLYSFYARSPVLDGKRMYVRSDSMYCIDVETGNTIWSFPSAYTSQPGSPSLNSKYVYYDENDTLWCRDKMTGALKWTVPDSDFQGTTASEDAVYHAMRRSVGAYDAETGAELWTHTIPENVDVGYIAGSGMARTDDVLVYIVWINSQQHGAIRALDLDDGTEIWERSWDSTFVRAPTIVGEVVYVCTYQPDGLLGLDLATGDIVYDNDSFDADSQPIFADEKLFVPTNISGGGFTVLGNDLVNVSEPAAATAFSMEVYPQPARTSLTIGYSLERSALVSLELYDLTGKVVAIQAQGYQIPGAYTAQLAAVGLSPGVYMARLTAGKETAVQRVVVQ